MSPACSRPQRSCSLLSTKRSSARRLLLGVRDCQPGPFLGFVMKEPILKRCCGCGHKKLLSKFYFVKSRGLYQAQCIACQKRRKKVRRKIWEDLGGSLICKMCEETKPRAAFNPNTHNCRRCQSFYKRYRLTPHAYRKLVLRAKGRCEICRRPRKLVVDHCHKTGKVRGMLCYTCNVYLGMMGDSVRRLKRFINGSISYLRSKGEKQ